MLHGDSGTGKSALLANWFVQQLGNIEDSNRDFFSVSDEERRKEIRTNFPPLIVAHFIGSSPQAAEPCSIHIDAPFHIFYILFVSL